MAGFPFPARANDFNNALFDEGLHQLACSLSIELQA